MCIRDRITLDRAVALGARGYLAPDVDRSELAAVAAHSLTGTVVNQTGVAPEQNGNHRPVDRPSNGSSAVELTKREMEVLIGMSHGRSNSQIGADLFLSEDTVKTHAHRLFRKLGASDRAQAVAIGLRAGLIR